MKRYLSLVFAAAMSVFCQAPLAQSGSDWRVLPDNNGFPMMFTGNDSGGVLGKWCDEKDGEVGCFWIVMVATRCDESMTAPVLVHTGKGVHSTNIGCLGEKYLGSTRYFRYVFLDPDKMDELFAEAERISIVMALEGDSFRVFRFSAKGSGAALTQWRASVAGKLKQRAKSTKDTTL
jgi:hypothetical protein